MHVDDVRDRSQRVESGHGASPLPTPFQTEQEKNGDPEEDEVLDACLESLHELGKRREGHPHSHPEHRAEQGDENHHQADGHAGPQELARSGEPGGGLRRVLTDSDQLFGDAREARARKTRRDAVAQSESGSGDLGRFEAAVHTRAVSFQLSAFSQPTTVAPSGLIADS